ncbi:MAG: 16S rRNA (guanine(527)-N(7))-methyltransferase RsmG [Clostridiales bacterium]|nr:16S rRNA (guanine(527)-N(7))-methyltransferase RsmG [Clostridiales bacterium]
MEELKTYLESKKIEYNPAILDKFNTYYNLLIEWNNKFNLTAITDKKEVEIKHFIDSLTALDYIKDNSLICDIGAGAGFPSIPLAILLPNCRFTLIDSLNKRVNFLNEVINSLGLTNCECIHARIEDFAIKNKEKYDIALARAVAPLNILLEYTMPILKINGILLSHKGSNINEEILEAENASKILNCKINNKYELSLPNGDYRCLIEYIKLKSTPPKYPRGGNKPRLNPLK